LNVRGGEREAAIFSVLFAPKTLRAHLLGALYSPPLIHPGGREREGRGSQKVKKVKKKVSLKS
jgi:hypothetical protein